MPLVGLVARGYVPDFDIGDHFANFLQAVRSRKHEDLNADIEEGHLSSALCHLGNISYRLGSTMKASEVAGQLESIDSADDLQATYDRTLAHLRDNKIDIDSLEIQVGKVLDFDPESEQFVDNAAADELLTRNYREPFVVPDENAI